MPRSAPRLSIITPVLNEASRLAAFLTTLTALDGDNEIIVVDGGSTDNTCDIAAHFAVNVVTATAGRGNQLAAGREAATGDLLWFVHVDSQIDPKSSHWIREAADKGTRCGCFSLFFHDSDALSIRMIAYLSAIRARWFRSLYGDQGIFCDAGFYDHIGGFARDLPLMEDVDFSRRARRQTTLAVLPHPIGSSARRFLDGGIWRTFWKMQTLKLKYFLGVPVDTLRKQY